MPSLSHHQSNQFTKLLIEGDSGSGKTGSLASLVSAGYSLRILDMDNGLDPLKQFILRDCPQYIDRVEYRTLRDKYKSSADGPVIDGTPRAFVDAVKMLDRWKYKDSDGIETDLGVPSEWGSEVVLVIDTLTFLSDAAWAFREPLAPRGKDGKYDARAVYKDAQDAIESVLAFVTGESFRTNVIVTSHIRYVDNPDGSRKGYPTSVGSALGPTIPRYFNSVALCESRAGKRTIQTAATAMIDLKNPKPFAMAKSYPIETGLAEFFGVLRATPETPTTTQASRASEQNQRAAAQQANVMVKPQALMLKRKL
jgi:AAA domain